LEIEDEDEDEDEPSVEPAIPEKHSAARPVRGGAAEKEMLS
jgi:hypothetical protein